MVVGGIVLGAPIMQFVFGESYIPGTLTFQILMFTLIFVTAGTMIGNYILAYDRQKDVAKFVAFASLGNIFFNYILIQPLGIAGAAIATIIVQSFYNIIMWRFAKGINNFHILTHIKKMALASFVMGLIAYVINLTHMHVLFNITISGLAYLGMLFVLKEPIVKEVLLTLKASKRQD